MQNKPRPRRIKWQLALVSALILLGIVSAVFLLRGGKPAPAPTNTLRFAQLPITYSAVTFLAAAKGFIKEEELNYLSISVPAGPDVVTALKGTGGNPADDGGIA